MNTTLLKMAVGAALAFAIWGFGEWKERAGARDERAACVAENTARENSARGKDINTRKRQNEIQNMDITPAAFDSILQRGAL